MNNPRTIRRVASRRVAKPRSAYIAGHAPRHHRELDRSAPPPAVPTRGSSPPRLARGEPEGRATLSARYAWRRGDERTRRSKQMRGDALPRRVGPGVRRRELRALHGEGRPADLPVGRQAGSGEIPWSSRSSLRQTGTTQVDGKVIPGDGDGPMFARAQQSTIRAPRCHQGRFWCRMGASFTCSTC